jgi:hypothetical protein
MSKHCKQRTALHTNRLKLTHSFCTLCVAASCLCNQPPTYWQPSYPRFSHHGSHRTTPNLRKVTRRQCWLHFFVRVLARGCNNMVVSGTSVVLLQCPATVSAVRALWNLSNRINTPARYQPLCAGSSCFETLARCCGGLAQLKHSR